MTQTTTPTDPPRRSSTMWASLVLAVCLIASGVTLALAGWKPEAIVGLMTGIGGVAAVMLPLLHKLTSLQTETAQQSATLQTITHQTNGVLAAKIDGAITAAIPRIVSAVRDAWSEPVPYVVTDPTPTRPLSLYEQETARQRLPVRPDLVDPLDNIA